MWNKQQSSQEGWNRPLSSVDASVAGPCFDPPVDGGATYEEDWGAWGGGDVEGADSCAFAGLAATNQVGTKVGLPEGVPMGPAGGVWLGPAGTKLEADPEVCSGVALGLGMLPCLHSRRLLHPWHHTGEQELKLAGPGVA